MTEYANQRGRRVPPHVSLAHLRQAVGLTLDEVCERITQEIPTLKPTRGAISAIEHGHRGASVQMLTALCAAYGLPPGSITTAYQPRQREQATA